MNRLIAVLLVVLIAPILPIGVLLFLIANPDYYRDALTERFHEQTGLTLVSADLGWRYFPPIALTLKNIQVNGLDGDALASLDASAIDVALWPLISEQRVDLRAVYIEGADINLVQDENGRRNWLLNDDSEAPSDEPRAEAVDESTRPVNLQLNIERIELVNSQLRYRDQIAQMDTTVQLTSLSTGAVEPGKPINVAIEALMSSATGLDAALKASGDITIAPGLKTITLEAFRTQLNTSDSGTSYEVDITTNTLLDMSGNMTRIDSEISGSIDALSVTGEITAALTEMPHISGELHVTTLNMNPYLTEDTGETSTAAAETATDTDTDTDTEEMIPMEAFRGVALELAISADTLVYDEYTFTNLATQIDNDDALAVTATLEGYGGTFDINSRVTHDEIPITDTTINIDGVDVAEFAELDWITGSLSLESTTQLTGAYKHNLNDQLTGTNRFVVTDGSMDITTLRRVVQLVATLTRQTHRVADWPDRLVFEELHGDLTLPSGLVEGQQLNLKADEFTIDGTGGIDILAREVDYALQLTFEEAPPEPDTPIPADQLAVDESLTRISWPITCAGSLDDSPATLCLPDREAVRGVIIRIANEKVAEKGEELLEKAKQKLEEKIPQNVRDKTKDLLEGLFN